MKTSRLEAFSDGVLAIIITIMVLELKAPEETTIKGLLHILPIFVSYVVSFIYVGIYWNNHHHLFQITEKVNGKILWANLHLLFWLSLIPFASSWIGEYHLESLPLAFYGLILFMSGIAFLILQKSILQHHGKDFALHKIKKENAKKTNLTLTIYVLGIGLSFVNVWLAIGCYVIVALFWVIPSKKIEENIF